MDALPVVEDFQVLEHAPLGLADEDLEAANAEYQRRRDETMRHLHRLPVVRPVASTGRLVPPGGCGNPCLTASERLLEHRVAAMPMRGWGGEVADRHVRFVFSNEPVDRLAVLGERVRAALAASGAATAHRLSSQR